MSAKSRVVSIAVGTLLHFIACFLGALVVAVFKVRSEVVLVVAGFYVPFVISGGLLGVTQGIWRPVVTALFSALLAAVLLTLLVLFLGGTPPLIATALIPSMLLSPSAAFAVTQLRQLTKHRRSQVTT